MIPVNESMKNLNIEMRTIVARYFMSQFKIKSYMDFFY
jgi:hypothetical protein